MIGWLIGWCKGGKAGVGGVVGRSVGRLIGRIRLVSYEERMNEKSEKLLCVPVWCDVWMSLNEYLLHSDLVRMFDVSFQACCSTVGSDGLFLHSH